MMVEGLGKSSERESVSMLSSVLDGKSVERSALESNRKKLSPLKSDKSLSDSWNN